MTATWECFRCHAVADGWAGTDGARVEDPLAMDGAISVCIDCAQVGMLTPTGPRMLTPEEWAGLWPDQEALRQIAQLMVSAQRRSSIIAARQQS